MERRHRPTAYVGGLVVVACAVAGLAWWLAPAAPIDPLAVVIAAALIAVGERTEVDFRWDRTRGSFTLTEVATAALLLLQPSPVVLLAIVPATLAAHAGLWRTPVKVLYNLATPLLGTALAAMVLGAFPTLGPLVGGRPVLGLLLGMLLHGAVSALLFGGLLATLQGRGSATELVRQAPMQVASTLGTTCVGIVSAALWEDQPALVPFVLALAAAVHLAQRSSVRNAALLTAQRAQSERLTRVVDGASEGIVLLDGDGRIQVWNPAMERLTRIDERQARGARATSLLAGVRVQPTAGSGWDPTADHGAHHEQEASFTLPDGSRRDVRERHATTYDDRGRATGSVVVVRDESRQRELERLRTDFVSRVSHELRTPLTPIRGFTSVLLRRGDLLGDDDRRDILERLDERARHLHHLVEDLLLVTHFDTEPTAATSGVPAGKLDVTEPVGAAVATLRDTVPARPVTAQAPSDLPQARGDAARIEKVVGILLDNAHRYTPIDTPITVTCHAETERVVVRVDDQGPGIPDADREAVFERFHRLEDPLTMRTGGVGVGLFLGRRLAEAMGGSLTLVDRPGPGCRFELRLPRVGAAATPSEGDGSRRPDTTATTTDETVAQPGQRHAR